MGGDNFNKTDDINGFVPFAPTAIKQTQMNAEHASWLQENHILESNIEILTSISKEIAKAAGQGLNEVDFHISFQYLNAHPEVSKQLNRVLNNNGFHLNSKTLVIDPKAVDEMSNIFGNWEIEGKRLRNQFVRLRRLTIRW